MASSLFVVGLSWRTAPVALREKLAVPQDGLVSRLQELIASPGIDEALILSTCNRVEIYGVTTRGATDAEVIAATAEARSTLTRGKNVRSEDVADAMYEKLERDGAQHIFRVAAALDSMVVGESQILGQLKQAYGVAVHCGATAGLLGRCLERAFAAAKKVRTETNIAHGAANVSSVAVELAEHVFGDLNGKQVLLVGAGKMSALAARHLRRAGASRVQVTNRSPERAAALAEEIEGEARGWEHLDTLLEQADVVISLTGASEPVLTYSMFRKALKRRRYRPVVVVDIAVPRDVEAKVAKLDGVYLFDIDDLRQVVDRNLRDRVKESAVAEKVVDSEVDTFEQWRRSQRVVPTIRSLRQHFSTVAQEETEKVIALLSDEHSAEERERAIRRLGDVIVNKLLHLPMTALKKGDRDVEALVKAAEELFDLERRRMATAEPDPELAAVPSANAGGKRGGVV